MALNRLFGTFFILFIFTFLKPILVAIYFSNTVRANAMRKLNTSIVF